MSTFDKIDFDRMTFKVFGNKKKIADFEEIKQFRSVFEADDTKGLDNEMIFRYLCYMYDPNSPLIMNIPDVKRRKPQALQLVNIEPPYSDQIDTMLRWGNKGVNDRAVMFLYIVGGEKYATWQYLLEKQQSVMTAEIDMTDKDAVTTEKTKMDILKAITKEIDIAKQAFLNGEKSMELEKNLISFTLADSLGIRPEEYVRVFERDGTIFPDVD